ncbi:MAG: hypothetical protein EP307_13960 [Rhodobacteraceae bacterium]|nr:MAG: hypothetical protein EP307_13960 [Paracoccaceae bacterium]
MLGLTTAAAAQTVAVQNGMDERGHGWMFRADGVCYVAMPAHVAGLSPRVTLTTAAPVATGTGTVILPFWEGIDLGLAVARGGIEARCTESLDRLKPDARARAAVQAQVLRLGPTGEEERVPIRIEDRGYLTFRGFPTDPSDILAKGTSGAFAFAGDAPIGMAYEVEDGATFMRAEEIHMNIARYLSEQGATFSATLEQTPIAAAANAVPMTLAGSSVPPINPQFAPENMLGPGLFVFQPQRLNQFTFDVQGDDAKPFSSISISAPTDAGHALPKDLLIEFSTSRSDARWIQWGRGQMGPDGVYDSGARAARNMAALRVTVLSVWGDGPVAIDRIEAIAP